MDGLNCSIGWEAHLTSGLVLSKNKGEPIWTRSPSLTIRFGFTPRKVLGEMATVSEPGMDTTSFEGIPAIRISCPFYEDMVHVELIM